MQNLNMSSRPISPVESKGLTLAFDVGHSSLGWAVLRGATPHPEILGCGTVTFPTDDCLAIKRRTYRRQRRHVRSLRQRIANLKTLLAAQHCLSEATLEAKHEQGGGHPAPWLLAARLLASNGAREHLLSWTLLWDVIRWYAHNRGYNANKLWSRIEEEDEDGDVAKELNAKNLMAKFDSQTMAETITRFMFAPHPECDPFAAEIKLPAFKNASRYKGQNAAFPRDVVEQEVRRLLEAHKGHLPGCDDALIRSLMEDWQALPCPALTLPLRYRGGLLFGQLIPRFENRIISECPFTKQKVPTRNTTEFLRYRWVTQIANIRVGRPDEEFRALTATERSLLNASMEERGYLTPGELKAAVRQITGCDSDNLEAMLLHPDMDQALQLIPIKFGKEAFRAVWTGLTSKHRQRYTIQLLRGKMLSATVILNDLSRLGDEEAIKNVKAALTATATKKGKLRPDKEEALLREPFRAVKLSGRAPYARDLLVQACREVMEGHHPRRKSLANDPEGEEKAADGCLVETTEMQRSALFRPLDQQTNNHLIRHRLLILERLIRDISADEGLTQGVRIGEVVIEVNRDLREMSGMTAKQMAQDMGLRLANFKSVVERLESDLAETQYRDQITPSLIRKGRIAMDLGWICPYTQGRPFDAIELATGAVDKDHIIPYSQRPSNSLDSLVITWPAVNKWKGNRTAYEFIEQEQGNSVPGRPDLTIVSLAKYKAFAEGLDTRKGHDDDRKRKRRRQELFLLPKWEEKDSGFLPRDLTVTSQLVRLGAQSVRRTLADLEPHHVTSIPGSVTGTLRNGWNLLGCLAQANPQVKADDGHGTKTKTEIRGITHLHHALDAIVLGLTAHYLPKDGKVWEAIVKRRPSAEEQKTLLATGIYARDSEGRIQLKRDLPSGLAEQISARLAEKRVVQHVPKDMGGMKVEENTRRVLSVEGGRAKLRQRSRDLKTGLQTVKDTEEAGLKLVGLEPGKLHAQQGARVITDNYGLAILDGLPKNTPDKDRFVIIPWHRIWHRMQELKERNGSKKITIIRNGSIIELTHQQGKRRLKVFGFGLASRDGIYLDVGETDAIKREKMLYLGGFLREKGKILSLSYCGSIPESSK